MTARHVVSRTLCAATIGLELIISSCTAAPGPPPPGGPPPSNQAGPLPPECASRVTEPDQAAQPCRGSGPAAWCA